MRVSILGTGGAGFGATVLLSLAGHDPMLWSPSGDGTRVFSTGTRLIARGAVEASFIPRIANTCVQAVSEADALMITAPGYGHKAIFDSIAPHIRENQPLIISSHVSFGALYLASLLEKRGICNPIIVWSTTLTTGRKTSPIEVQLNSIRTQIDMTTFPEVAAAQGSTLCVQLFGNRFKQRNGLIAIALSNLNPQNHLAISLMNMTRMELAETWNQSEHITPAVGRLIEALDLERLAIANHFRVSVRTVQEHFARSYPVQFGSVHEMNQEMARKGIGGFGPKTAESRYVLEDVPFGLVATAQLGRIAGVPVPLHEAGIALLSAAYGRDFAHENDLLRALDIESLSSAELEHFVKSGTRLA